jgi:putative sugar O-methyltransferase
MSRGLTTFHAAYERCVGFAARVAERDDLSEHVSAFWSEALGERRNYPNFDEMLVMRRGYTYPIADRADVEDREADREYAEAAWKVARQTVDRSYFDKWEESTVGTPFSYSFDGARLTPGGIVNALTSQRIVRQVRESGLGSRPLRILEIGAGYGQVAHQLLQQLDIVTYAVCDLPENAFLSSFYLQCNWPGRKSAFIAAEADAADGDLVFTVPPLLAKLGGPWDVVINSYSFQEMTRESVDGYLAHAAATLTRDGFLYSLNAHGKALTGIERPSDYAAPGLSISSIAPVRRYPWQMFATVPYELVMRRGAESGPPPETVRKLEGLGRAMQLGLHDEIEELCAAFGTGARADRLDALAAFGDASFPVAERAAAARDVGGLVGAHLEATLAAAVGADDAAEALRAAIGGLAGTHAEVRDRVTLASMSEDATRQADLARAIALAPHLERDIRYYAAAPTTLRTVLGEQLGLPAEPGQADAEHSALQPLRRWLSRHRRAAETDRED